MEIPVINLNNEKIDEIEIPEIFNTPIRPSVIKRAVIIQQTHRIQPQGRDPMAGKRTTAESKGTGLGIARVPRIKNSNRAAFGVSIVGGHQAFPPFSTKSIKKKINKKERLLAIRSGIAASVKKEMVANRGHRFPNTLTLPIVVGDELETLEKTRDVKDFFQSIGIWEDVKRADRNKIRAGKGKRRGRKKKVGKGPLIIISEDRGISRAARNLPGVDIYRVDDLNAELLAPGTHLGRLIVWSHSAFNKLDKIWGDF
jgi:large subunit ribosomal protein L4e